MSKLQVVVIDIESFWSQTHSLSKMSPISYVMHPDTEIISMAIKTGNTPTVCMFGEETIAACLRNMYWGDKLCVAHNMSGFDAMILAWRFGVYPAMWGCTLAMSRPWHMKDVGGSLAALVKHYQLGVKDATALHQTKGRHMKDFTTQELSDMRKYNIADVEQCAQLFKIFAAKTPKSEMKLIDQTIRMLVMPQFVLDTALLTSTLEQEKARKQAMLIGLAKKFGWTELSEQEPQEFVRAMLASASQFAALLATQGVATPMKPSPTNPDKQVPALAKTDEAFIALQDHPNEVVSTAARARLEVKSTLLETRIEKFLEAGARCGGRLPVPLKYYGGHTGRFSGEQYNPQNMPRIPRDKDGNIIDKPTNALRMSLRAPEGYKIVVADLSGIELRVNHFLWQVPSSMALFQEDPEKADLYRHFASILYNVEPAAVTKAERQIGKVCLAEGTMLLCKRESAIRWLPIEEFSPDYQLWDGSDWVWAKGLASNGLKKTQELCGIWLTPDHLVLSGATWMPARCLNEEKYAAHWRSLRKNYRYRLCHRG